MHLGDRTLKVIAVVILCASVGLIGWGVGKGVAEEEPVGQYQAAAPDLVLDTATGKLINSTGQVLEQAIDPSGTTLGKYSAAGYATAVTRNVGLSVINQPIAYTETVKGYAIVDTQSGRVVKHRIYYQQTLKADDF